jgi:hypothetical protein
MLARSSRGGSSLSTWLSNIIHFNMAEGSDVTLIRSSHLHTHTHHTTQFNINNTIIMSYCVGGSVGGRAGGRTGAEPVSLRPATSALSGTPPPS